ncbi:MAG TPA: phosphosulfolactate synthase, partial [Candidatus Nitrosocosmicus sp.]|nr:phosphosulfolactate synthase [Candidatus Nitrosocosmicus sp.]
DHKKPRHGGITYIIDKFQGFDRENFEIISPFVDIVKIYGAYPLLISDNHLIKRINFYHDNNVLVSTGSTLTEYALRENIFNRFVEESKIAGFDIIEISENNIHLALEEKKKITKLIESHDLRHQWKIGRKDPRRQLTVDETIKRANEALEINQREKIILEANLGYSVGLFDEKGDVKWNLLSAITSKIPPNNIIFEAPLEIQQAVLIAEFGQRVNLGEVKLENVASVESQRRGFLSKASFNINPVKKGPEGSPATKFIYYIIRSKHPIEQSELIYMTNLPRRTVQASVEELRNQGLIIEKNSLDDTRKKVYNLVKDEWV